MPSYCIRRRCFRHDSVFGDRSEQWVPCLQLLTPVRRSARKPSQAPASAGRMMAATGFAYAPNEALQARMAHLAAEGKLVLGDAQDPGIRARLQEASPFNFCRATSMGFPSHAAIPCHSCMPKGGVEGVAPCSEPALHTAPAPIPHTSIAKEVGCSAKAC